MLRSIIAILPCLLHPALADHGSPVGPSHIVLHNGSIYTMDQSSTRVSALAVKDGKIAYVGSDDGAKSFIGKTTKVMDLKGRMAILNN
ncbi:hypothetical protein CDD80_1996 [Ophiocordyceps camponoti-rufipedis]|uniref:Amidohydrolase-related domain-containing protein n=1 Tax=Ophiocordyceps camponoti-rufipedis TaxID=2004952 RepID=A0A2C5Z7W6_9HYPO|nr:hypothetical protein CDD80_1996 [Ophiocordyceps camponoti-rufipedis]